MSYLDLAEDGLAVERALRVLLDELEPLLLLLSSSSMYAFLPFALEPRSVEGRDEEEELEGLVVELPVL